LELAWTLWRREEFCCLRRELNLDSSVDAFYFTVSFTTIHFSPDLRKGLFKSGCGGISTVDMMTLPSCSPSGVTVSSGIMEIRLPFPDTFAGRRGPTLNVFELI
jgi:hypothetical protein